MSKYRNNAEWFWNTRLSYFRQMYLWIHDNYSSKRFQQCEWQRKILLTINFKKWTVNLSHGSVSWGLTFGAEGSWGAGSIPGTATFLFFFFCLCFFLSSYFFPSGLFPVILTAAPFSFARFLRWRMDFPAHAHIKEYCFIWFHYKPEDIHCK